MNLFMSSLSPFEAFMLFILRLLLYLSSKKIFHKAFVIRYLQKIFPRVEFRREKIT
jgi:hypothetical protein